MMRGEASHPHTVTHARSYSIAWLEEAGGASMACHPNVRQQRLDH